MSSPAGRAPLLLTVSDTARRLGRHEQTVRAMIRRGDLAAVRLGRLVRVPAAAVDRPRRPRPPRTIERWGSRRAVRQLAGGARA